MEKFVVIKSFKMADKFSAEGGETHLARSKDQKGRGIWTLQTTLINSLPVIVSKISGLSKITSMDIYSLNLLVGRS